MKRWKWTRKRYERARRLSRLLGCLATAQRVTPPEIVESYWRLMRPIEQQCDPMDPTTWAYRDIRWRLAQHKDPDGVPF